MPLNIYRYHNRDCKEKLLALKLPVEAHKAYTDCNCTIWMEGETDGCIQPRTSTKLRNWKAAEALMRSMEAKGKDTVVHGELLKDCIKWYTDSREHELGKKVKGQYAMLLGRLNDYAIGFNKFHIRQLTVDDYENFKTYGLPDMKDTSKGTMVSKLRCFLKDAFRRGWILEPMALKVKAHDSVNEQVEPFTAEEVALILAFAQKLNGGINGFASSGKTFALMLRTLVEVGMRCGDMLRYNPQACYKSITGLWVYQFEPQKQKKGKTPKQAKVYLTEELKFAIDNCDWLSKTRPFAYLPVSNNDKIDKTTYMANEVYERMKSVGKMCGVEDCRPHRLRHTFAHVKLLKGVSLPDLSRLMYHSGFAVTEKYYSKWVPPLEERLERVFLKSLVHSES